MSNNNQGGFQQDDYVGRLKSWFDECPLFTKGTIYICTTIAVLNIVTAISDLFVNFPKAIVTGLQIHRLFISPFAFFSIFEVLFAFFAFLPSCAKQEKEWGTVKTIVDFFWKNLLVNVLFVVFVYFLSLFTDLALKKLFCYGLWQIFFVNLVERCLRDPEGVSMLLCLPVQIKNKYYPLVLWLLFSLISGSLRVDNLVSMGVGYIHFKYLNEGYYAFLSDARMSSWSGSFVFAWMRNLPNYVNSSGGMSQSSGSSSTPGPVIGRVGSNNSSNNQQQQSGGGFNTFGGKGVAIGGDEENPVPKQGKNYMPLQDDVSDLDLSDRNPN